MSRAKQEIISALNRVGNTKFDYVHHHHIQYVKRRGFYAITFPVPQTGIVGGWYICDIQFGFNLTEVIVEIFNKNSKNMDMLYALMKTWKRLEEAERRASRARAW